MRSYIPNTVKFLFALLPIVYFTGCNNTPPPEQAKEEIPQEYHYNLNFPLVRIDRIPQRSTISRYTNEENIVGKISDEGASEILVAVNSTDKRCFLDQDYRPLHLRVNRPIIGVDFNMDGKIFGQPGENVGQFTFRKFPKSPKKPLDEFVIDVENSFPEAIYANAEPNN